LRDWRGKLSAMSDRSFKKAAQGGGYTGNIIVSTELASARFPAE
jgi:hypothetical protein